MEWWMSTLIIIGGLLVIFATGMPVALCFLLINVIGVTLWWGGTDGFGLLALSMADSVSKFSWLPVPLFIFMGEIMFRSGIATNMIDVLDKLLGRLPGRLGLVAVAAGTILAVLTGASTGSAAVLGSTLTPEMEKRGYAKCMSLGPILGSAGLAAMIPPSGMAVIIGGLAEISIGKLLIAGIVPGLMMAAVFSAYIIIRCKLQPHIAPTYEFVATPFSQILLGLLKFVLPLGTIVFMVIGLLFLGVATPAEAAAMGTLATIALSIAYRKFSWQVLKISLYHTLRTSCMILFIVTGAAAFSYILAFSKATEGIVQLAVGLPVSPFALVTIMMIIIVILGGPLSASSLAMISLPIYMPIIRALHLNEIWFGALMLLNMEISGISPPFGLVLFVTKGVAPKGTTMGDVFLAAMPFVYCDLIVMAIMIASPALVLWLPSLMR